MNSVREKIDALAEVFKREFGLDVKIIVLALDYRNPYLTAYDAVALRDTISLRAGLDERFATCHASYFVVTCTEPHPARASVSVYCAEEWPESLLGDAPKEGAEEEQEKSVHD